MKWLDRKEEPRMKGIETLKKSINVKDAPAGTTVDFAICVKQIDKDTLNTRVEGAANIAVVIVALQEAIAILLKNFNVEPLEMLNIISNIIADCVKEEE